MGLQIVSPDISYLDFKFTLDISGNTPIATFENLSTITNPSNLDWVFELYSPSGVPIYQGNFDNPDVNNGGWTSPFLINSGFPMPNNQIEWGNDSNPYIAKVKVKDGNNQIFELEKRIPLCRPSGNNKDSKNYFGETQVDIKTLCKTAQLFCEDKTNYTYRGLAGTPVSKVFTLIKPPDDNGNPPAPVVVNNFNSCLINIQQSGSGYQWFLVSIFQYDYGDNIFVKIKYINNRYKSTFTVYCNLDISPIACELSKLDQRIDNGDCEDIAEAKELSNRVTSKLLRALIGILYPLTGIDPYQIIEEIKELTGWDCNCCSKGIVPLASISSNNISYSVNKIGGDISASFDLSNPSAVVLQLYDISYTFNICSGTTSSAFQIINKSATNYSKEFCFTVNLNTLASEILTEIGSSTILKQTLNNLIISNANFALTVDYKCIEPSQSCSYTFTSANLSAYTQILVEGFEYVFNNQTYHAYVNFIFDKTNASQLQTALNNLNLGTFTVTYASNVLTIQLQQTNLDIKYFTYSPTNANIDLKFIITKDCSNNVVTENVSTVVQKIINWICGLVLKNIKAGQSYIIKKITEIGQPLIDILTNPEDDASKLLYNFIQEYNNLVNIVNSITQFDCNKIDSVFQTYPLNVELQTSDYLLGNVAKQCVKVPYDKIAKLIFRLAKTNQDIKNEFCEAVSLCGKAICQPVSNMTVTYNSTTQTLTAVILNNGALQYRIGYRIADSGQNLSGIQVVSASNTINTTVTWNGITPNNYEVVVVAICGDGESEPFIVKANSCAKPISFNVTFDEANNKFNITYSVPSGVNNVKINVIYPNGGTYTTIQPVGTGTASISRPNNLFGVFEFNLQSVCDTNYGWYSEPTNSILIDVPEYSSCPMVTDIQVSNIGQNSVTITATKPIGNNVNGFKLVLTNLATNQVTQYIANNPGSQVTWNISGLMPATQYSIVIYTICSAMSGNEYESMPAVGPNFTTASGATNNSSLINNTGQNFTFYSVEINGSIVLSGTNLNVGNSVAFNTGNYTNATVSIVAPDIKQLTSATLVSNSITYTGVFNGPGTDPTVVFSNVNIANGMVITLTYSP